MPFWLKTGDFDPTFPVSCVVIHKTICSQACKPSYSVLGRASPCPFALLSSAMAEPSALELQGFQTIQQVLDWVPFQGPDRQWFMESFGFAEGDPVRLLGRLKDGDIENLWGTLEEPPKVALRAKVEITVQVARLKCGLLKSSAAVAEESAEARARAEIDRENERKHELMIKQVEAEAQKEAAAAAATAAALAAASRSNVEAKDEADKAAKKKAGLFNLNSVVSQLMDEWVPLLPMSEITELFQVYWRQEGGPPGKEMEPSEEQISAVKYLSQLDANIFIDLAVWCANHNQKKKSLFFIGLVVGAGNVLKQVELRAPPTFEEWEAAMLVLRVVFIMLQLVNAADFDAYVAKVRSYARRYGPQAWALLYQAESRMRSHHFVRIHRRLSVDTAGNPEHPFHKKPWSAVYREAAYNERDYWSDEFTEVAHLVRIDGKVLQKELGRDAAIDADVHERTRNPKRGREEDDRGRGAEPRIGNTRVHKLDESGRFAANRQGKSLCKGFQTGCCKSARGTILCPQNSAESHQCNKCLDFRHGGDRCPLKDDEMVVPTQPRGGAGRGRGGRGRGRNRGGRR